MDDSDNAAYEADFLPRGDRVHKRKILGRRTEADALECAQQLADHWDATVHLHRVPYQAEGVRDWDEEQRKLVKQVWPTGSRRVE